MPEVLLIVSNIIMFFNFILFLMWCGCFQKCTKIVMCQCRSHKQRPTFFSWLLNKILHFNNLSFFCIFFVFFSNFFLLVFLVYSNFNLKHLRFVPVTRKPELKSLFFFSKKKCISFVLLWWGSNSVNVKLWEI